MKLTQLHEDFMDKATRPMTFGKLPILPKAGEVPIIAVNKWMKVDGKLQKKYDFSSIELRNRFVAALLAYEVQVGHNAAIVIEEESVAITVYTKDVDVVTELDKEYAAATDTSYKDVVYSRSDAGRK